MHLVIIITPRYISFRCGKSTGSDPYNGTVTDLAGAIARLKKRTDHRTHEILWEV